MYTCLGPWVWSLQFSRDLCFLANPFTLEGDYSIYEAQLLKT